MKKIFICFGARAFCSSPCSVCFLIAEFKQLIRTQDREQGNLSAHHPLRFTAPPAVPVYSKAPISSSYPPRSHHDYPLFILLPLLGLLVLLKALLSGSFLCISLFILLVQGGSNSPHS